MILASARPTPAATGKHAKRTWPSASAIRSALLAALGLLALLHVGGLLSITSQVTLFPYDLDYGEGYVLNDAVRLARREPIYVDLQQFPMVRSPYPPLFPAVWSLVIPAAGPALWPGRLIASLALAGLLGLVAWNARRAGAGPWAVVAAPAALAASPLVYDWAGLARVDTLAILLAVAAVLAAEWLGGWRGVATAAALAGLALWTKQTMVAAPVAITIAFALESRRKGLAFALLLLVPSAAAGLWLEQASAGQFSRHVLFGNSQNPFNVGRMVASTTVALALHVPPVAAALWWALGAPGAWRFSARRPRPRASLGHDLVEKRPGCRRRPTSPLAVYVSLALLTALAVGNEGSSVNYFLEPVTATALALPFAWRSADTASTSLAPLLTVVYLLLNVHLPNGFGLTAGALPVREPPATADRAAGAALDAAIQAEVGPVLVEAAGFAVRNGRPVYVQPVDLRAEEALGRWRSQPLVEALASGQFGLVVMSFHLLPRDAEVVLATRFRLERVLAGEHGLTYQLYRYRG